MSKAYEVMTHALATCAPDTSVAHVATMMREREIGNVLVMEDGKLCGIVTDRDLAIQALTGQDDPLKTPIRKFMSTDVTTGDATWSLEQVARVMARHEIRRLPILLEGQLVGIVSLGDIARFENQKNVIIKSLQAVSTPTVIPVSGPSRHTRVLLGFALALTSAMMMVWLNWNYSGRALRKQIAQSVQDQAQGSPPHNPDLIATKKSIRHLRHQMHSDLNTISAKLPV